MKRTLFYEIGSKLDPYSLEVGDLFYFNGNVCIVMHGSFGFIYKILGCPTNHSLRKLNNADIYAVSMLQDCVEIAGLKFNSDEIYPDEIYHDEIYPDGHLG
jgi:hypothetical protein